MKCLCGHQRWLHCGKGNRGKCMGEVPKPDITRKRGYRMIPCDCPMYHTVELGQVKIFKAGEK